jgi:hypothetical protein
MTIQGRWWRLARVFTRDTHSSLCHPSEQGPLAGDPGAAMNGPPGNGKSNGKSRSSACGEG